MLSSTRVQVLVWFHETKKHYLNQCLQSSYDAMTTEYMASLSHNELTHWGWDKIAAISQTTFSNAFSWMKMHEFCLRFHQSLFLRFKLTKFQHWFIQWLGTRQATSHYLNQGWLVYRHMCVTQPQWVNGYMHQTNISCIFISGITQPYYI